MRAAGRPRDGQHQRKWPRDPTPAPVVRRKSGRPGGLSPRRFGVDVPNGSRRRSAAKAVSTGTPNPAHPIGSWFATPVNDQPTAPPKGATLHLLPARRRRRPMRRSTTLRAIHGSAVDAGNNDAHASISGLLRA